MTLGGYTDDEHQQTSTSVGTGGAQLSKIDLRIGFGGIEQTIIDFMWCVVSLTVAVYWGVLTPYGGGNLHPL